MEQKPEDKKNEPATSTELTVPSGWSKREVEVLGVTTSNGIKPISPTISSQMYNLFLEGYTCAIIAKLNKGFSEGDVLYCRQKFKWDDQRDEYALQLTNQVQQKVIKQKLESIEYLTNILSVIHKAERDTTLKFLQTGNTDDLPNIGSLKTYKDVIETLAKITGESNTKKLKLEGMIQQETTIKNESGSGIQITPELHTKLLEILARDSELVGVKGKKSSE